MFLEPQLERPASWFKTHSDCLSSRGELCWVFWWYSPSVGLGISGESSRNGAAWALGADGTFHRVISSYGRQVCWTRDWREGWGPEGHEVSAGREAMALLKSCLEAEPMMPKVCKGHEKAELCRTLLLLVLKFPSATVFPRVEEPFQSPDKEASCRLEESWEMEAKLLNQKTNGNICFMDFLIHYFINTCLQSIVIVGSWYMYILQFKYFLSLVPLLFPLFLYLLISTCLPVEMNILRKSKSSWTHWQIFVLLVSCLIFLCHNFTRDKNQTIVYFCFTRTFSPLPKALSCLTTNPQTNIGKNRLNWMNLLKFNELCCSKMAVGLSCEKSFLLGPQIN